MMRKDNNYSVNKNNDNSNSVNENQNDDNDNHILSLPIFFDFYHPFYHLSLLLFFVAFRQLRETHAYLFEGAGLKDLVRERVWVNVRALWGVWVTLRV